jgi:Protein of unknown function DUF262
MDWKKIEKFPHISYRVCVGWNYLQETLEEYKSNGLDLNPDFQRGHVWTEDQQIKFVEYALKEPQSGLEIYFNQPYWMNWTNETLKKDFVLVDGKQRLEAARRFMANEIPAFGCLCKDFTGFHHIPNDIQFFFNIARLPTRAAVLKWYLDFNAGGTPHSKKEIERVRELLAKEK